MTTRHQHRPLHSAEAHSIQSPRRTGRRKSAGAPLGVQQQPDAALRPRFFYSRGPRRTPGSGRGSPIFAFFPVCQGCAARSGEGDYLILERDGLGGNSDWGLTWMDGGFARRFSGPTRVSRVGDARAGSNTARARSRRPTSATKEIPTQPRDAPSPGPQRRSWLCLNPSTPQALLSLILSP